jgi:type II secretory pathway component PulF
MDTGKNRGTSAHQPDLNWSQVRETVLMLELAAVQIESAMKDSNTSVDVLTNSFTTMASYMRTISDAVQTLPDQWETGQTKQNLIGISENVSSMMHQAIIAFQFYDKLVQRLAHVGHSLGDLSDLVGDTRRLFSPYEWVDLQQKIKAKYTTADEVAMFEAVMQGMPVQEAVDKFMAEMKNKNDDIELF